MAGIGYCNLGIIVINRNSQCYRSARIGEFNGIVKEVGYHAL